jgi:hypothetical protein
MFVHCPIRGCRGHDRMVVGFTIIFTCAISAYHHFSWEFESHCCRCVLDTTLSMTCGMSVVSSTNKTDRYDMTEILLKVVLNTVTPHCYIRVYIMDDYFKQQILCPFLQKLTKYIMCHQTNSICHVLHKNWNNVHIPAHFEGNCAFIGLLSVFYVYYLLLVTAAMLDDLWDIQI